MAIRICPYRNVWPEAVYCCFTRTTSFTILFIYICMIRVRGCYHFTKYCYSIPYGF